MTNAFHQTWIAISILGMLGFFVLSVVLAIECSEDRAEEPRTGLAIASLLCVLASLAIMISLPWQAQAQHHAAQREERCETLD